MLRNANLNYATRGRVKKRTKAGRESMMVLENVDVTTRARRVHLDLPHSQVMVCVTCRLEEKSASFPHWWWEVRSGVFGEKKKNSETLEVP